MTQLRSSRFAGFRVGGVRRSALGAIAGGCVFVAAAGVQWVSPSASSTNLLLAAALLITAAGLVGIHIRYGHSYGALGALGALATGLGQLVQAASAVGSAVAGDPAGDPASGWPTWLFVTGSLLFLPGLLVLATAIFRSGLAPRWLGLVLIGGVLASGVGGPALFGTAWIVVGYLLIRQDAHVRTETESYP